VPTLALAQPKQKPGVTYDAEITRVIDGDTVAFQRTLSTSTAQARTVNPSVWR
jgi:endonuclease YncB( thermonuclease family)